MPVFADELARFFFDPPIHVLLGVHEELLAALFVLEADFVEVRRAAALRASRQERAARLIIGERIGRHLLGIVNAAGDDRPIRIALEKVHDYFLTDARNADRAPVLARPRT